jgi:hypothetical protein
VIQPLVDAIRTRQAILFAGAGLSRNLGLPSWGELIGEMAKQLGYDPEVFAGHGGYLELAEYYELQKTSMGALRSWMDRTWHTDEARVDKSRVHSAVIGLKFPTIYTTNYDRWLEIAFQRQHQPFVKIANVGDFTRAVDGLTQIVKLHGDFDDDSSLVLTETSYFDRLAFESPLDLKLRSDTIGKSVLFVGYSLSDVNVRYLLYKLHRLWADSKFSSARPKSYLFLTRPNPIQEAILENRGIIPIVSSADDEGTALRDFLEKLLHEAFGTSTSTITM